MVPCSVLVVEDDADSREMLAAILRLDGHEVVTASDGHEAWQALGAGPLPAVIVTDLLMPRVDGLELLERVRADQRTAELRVVILTGSALPEPGEPNTMIVRKPAEPDMLLGLVRKACGAWVQ